MIQAQRSRADAELKAAAKDNTGEKRYVEEMVFPTLRFPSDHGIVSATLAIKEGAGGGGGGAISQSEDTQSDDAEGA